MGLLGDLFDFLALLGVVLLPPLLQIYTAISCFVAPGVGMDVLRWIGLGAYSYSSYIVFIFGLGLVLVGEWPLR